VFQVGASVVTDGRTGRFLEKGGILHPDFMFYMLAKEDKSSPTKAIRAQVITCSYAPEPPSRGIEAPSVTSFHRAHEESISWLDRLGIIRSANARSDVPPLQQATLVFYAVREMPRTEEDQSPIRVHISRSISIYRPLVCVQPHHRSDAIHHPTQTQL
jgi:hypothetical protein